MESADESAKSIKRENEENKSGVHELLNDSLGGVHRLNGRFYGSLWLKIARLLGILILQCVLITLASRMEGAEAEATSLKNFSECDLVFSKSSRAFHVVRHMQRMHGT